MGRYKSITVIISPCHVGLRNIRVGRGPHALLDAGLIENIKQTLPKGFALNVEEIRSVQTVLTDIEGDIGRSFAVLRYISVAVQKAVQEESWPLVLSGNCMDVVGVNAGLNPVTEDGLKKGQISENKTREVIWFDAHADLETPDTTRSGYLDGMGGSMLLGEGFGNLLGTIPGYAAIEGRQLLGVGFRDFSESEEKKIREKGVRTVFGKKPLDRGHYLADLASALEDKNTIGLVDSTLHLDVDVLDTSVGRANEFAVEGGLGEQDLIDCMDLVGEKREVKAMHVASLNPEYERWENIARVAIRAIIHIIQNVFDDGSSM
ncbi:hypothetical protein LTR70_000869 [Exophiala xenobiotica]|uniref:Arginase n=1 Tax=Lithohypha guttulata TaxID=1690604 RepID=A0ABR0KKH4_9EURO|nr:hypothetical protein LTR24_001637 [Lithohypha guttulata]KAK5329033.1 hypothetical protein LTR70_000869 [Exophiala xenobiotica]